MDASRSSYEKDLPEDLLELIDHTTRGVERLYEATRRAEVSNTTRGTRQPSATRRAVHVGTSSNTLAAQTHTSHAGGVYNGLSLGKNTLNARRGIRSHPHVLPNGNSTDGRSAPTTANTTLSSDAPTQEGREPELKLARPQQRRQPQLLERQPPHDRRPRHSANSSGAEEQNSSRGAKGWKETFKSLLADVPAASTSDTSVATATFAAPAEVTKPEMRVLPKVETPAAVGTALASALDVSTPLSQGSERGGGIQPALFVNAVVSSTADASHERLRRRLEEVTETHRVELARLRAEHQREIAQVRRDALAEQQRACEEVSAQLLASFGVKQKLLRAEMESEQRRSAEANRALDERIESDRRERAAHESALAEAQRQRQSAEKEAEALRESLKSQRRHMAETQDTADAARRELEEATRHAEQSTRREEDAVAHVARLETQLREQQSAAKEELRRLEAEFAAATERYEGLVREAMAKLAALEQVQRKYRQLKEQHRRQREALRASDASAASATGRLDLAAHEAEELRLQLARKEHELREARAGHASAQDSLTQRLAEAERRASRAQDAWQSCAQQAEEDAGRAQREVAALSAQLEEERTHGAALLAQLEASAQRQKTELAAARRAAGETTAQAEETISSLKRQMREKDARLEALASAGSEPLARLRRQLEEERGRRATLEEQFAQYKQRAKAAEEAALREIRREQSRAAAVSGRVPAKATPSATPFPETRGGEARRGAGLGNSLALSRSGTTTPIHQRAPKAFAPPAPLSYNRGTRRAKSASATPVGRDTASPSVASGTGVHEGRGAWDSVGSISNISCSSPCSSNGAVGHAGREGVPRPHPTSLPPLAEDNDKDGDAAENDDLDASNAKHEELLREFHESAAEVFRKITGNRDEFLKRCTSVVRAVAPGSARAGGVSPNSPSDSD